MWRLSNVCKINSGIVFSSNDYRTEGIPLIRIFNIKNNTINLTECVFIKSTIDDRFIISRGDLLIAMSGATTGKMGIYENDNIALKYWVIHYYYQNTEICICCQKLMIY